jgi:hypothetical protein
MLSLYSLLATELLAIIKLHPHLVLEYSDELIEFVCAMKGLDDGFEQFFTHLVSLITLLSFNSRSQGRWCMVNFNIVVTLLIISFN